MITITKDQEVAENPALRVMSPSGDYEDTALIEFYNVSQPGRAVGAYHAQYVRYGSLVYRYSDPIELGKAILAIDADSTHTAASYVRMSEELLSKMNSGALEPESLTEVLEQEQTSVEDKRTEQPEESETQAVETQDEADITPKDEPASADIPVPASDVSSTTPAVIDALEEASSTPLLEIPADIPTTTEEVVSLIKKKVAKKLLS